MTTIKYEPVIGLEIHAELLTSSKMFCSCSAVYSASSEPNTLICPVCTGLPGAMPVVNERAVELAVLVGLALNCSINETNSFARKNYFYPDLPKGYQISQYDLPVASDGWLEILEDSESGSQRVRVRRAHLEEDTAKLFHHGDYALVDFNRAGVPLLEIVSEPDMHSIEAVLAYAMKIRSILRYLGVNSGDMEKGVLRFEANVSVRPFGTAELLTRTEIKNLNSFRALTRASAYEIERQTRLVESGGTVVQQTMGWDDAREVTVPQRSKEEAHDYRYFPEPDLPPLRIEPARVTEIRAKLPELPTVKSQRFVDQYGLTLKEARLLTSEKALADYFEAVVAHAKSPAKNVSHWVAGDLLRLINDRSIEFDQIPVSPDHLAELIDLVSDKTITLNSSRDVLAEMIESGQRAGPIVKAKGLTQISDEKSILEVVTRVLDENPDAVAQFLKGKETILQWLMGQVARATQGKADPQVSRRLLTQGLAERGKSVEKGEQTRPS